ncbi:hypothetical protein GCM10028807_55730 [Spirosoma daeguense]
METLTIEIKTAKARKLIDDLIDLGIISIKTEPPIWADLWNKLDGRLPQTEPDMSDDEIMDEIKAYRIERRNQSNSSI